MGRISYAVVIALGALLVSPGCGDDREPPEVPPRPVSWFKLATLDPGTMTRHTGSVESWKKELVGFEVGGRVDDVIEPGLDVEGRRVTLEGKVLSEGDSIAKLDETRYKIAVQQAQADVRTAESRVAVIRTEIDETLPQRLKEAQEDRDFKQREFRRYEELAAKGVEAASRMDEARRDYRTAETTVNQITATFNEKKALLGSLEASVASAQEQLRQAEENLRDCTLYSPFTGQASKVHVIPGGFVTKGQPVVSIQMMDPMKVEVAVSAQTDEQIHLNDSVRVFVRDQPEPLEGSVYLKASVADSATRTFMVTLLVRNKRVAVGAPKDLDTGNMLAIPLVTNLVKKTPGEEGPWFVEERALHKDGEGHFVWIAKGMSRDDLYEAEMRVFDIQKVRVDVGPGIFPILQLFQYRELSGIGSIDPAKDLIVHDVPEGTSEGTQAYFARDMWLLRPGQLVRVDLRRGTLPAGLYVPMNAIAKKGDTHSLFLVEDGPNGAEVAKKVDIKLMESFGEFRHVEPVEAGALKEGARVVLEGAHYLRDGEAINAFDEQEVRP